MDSEGNTIHERVSALSKAAEKAAPPLSPSQLAAVHSKLSDAVERWEAIAGHTVAALVGGTGSGKSSIFNILAGKDFAEVGVLRPTTRQASSCAWGVPAAGLLDHLGVAPARRMDWDVALARPGDEDLDGLILLDLPDHDSVEEQHSHMVDAVLPVVDVLVWVIDPQKYADHLLHERYLATLRRRADVMVVALNHSDTLSEEGLATVKADVVRILAEAGLDEVPVVVSRAVKGPEGVEEVRDCLKQAVANQATAVRTAESDIDSVAAELAEWVAEREPELSDEDVLETVEGLVRASGVDVAVDSIAQRTPGGAADFSPARAAVTAIGATWASGAKQGLPKGWSDEVDRALPSVEALSTATSEAIGSVELPPAPRKRAEVVAVLAVLVALGAAAALQPWKMGPGLFLALAVVALTIGGAVLALGLTRRGRKARAKSDAAQYREDVRDAVRRVVESMLAAPAEEVHARHRALREALRRDEDKPRS